MSLKLPRSHALRVALYVVAFALLLGAGRMGQKAWDGLWFGHRGPYLQMPAPTAMTVRWETAEPSTGRVRYGLAPDNMPQAVAGASGAYMHEVRIEGLDPATRYYYQVEADGKDFMAAPASFVTPPAPGSAQATRLWVIGDSGKPGKDQNAVRDAALGWMAAHPRVGRPPMDVWLALGDNAYTSGRNVEFQRALFEPYAALLREVAVWPAYGNHDARRWVHYDIFSLPENGEAGGVPSGTERWYAFDHGPVHVVVLDSEASVRSDQMLQWLREDLAANRSPWRIVALHHPPYSRGGHDSDDWWDSGGRMTAVRERLLPVLEAAGVDLVLAGHSHVYERSHLLACHYGTSQELTEGMILARSVPGAAFEKHAQGAAAYDGTVYAVVGSSSKLDRGPLDHPAHATALRELGSLVIDVDGLRLEARFINDKGEVRDEFAIVKGAGAPRTGVCAQQAAS
ncbi:MAG: metallophosphoesterase [Thiohalomonadaceae bacterium]